MKKTDESVTGAGYVDDGPRFMYGNSKTYMAYARRMAAKLGMSVEDWLIDIDKEFEIHDTDGIPKTVSYFPTGDADATNHGTDYHPDMTGKAAYNLWVARAERLATIANDVNVVDDVGAKHSIDDSGIIVETVNEIGDASATPYTVELETDSVKSGTGIVHYTFKTESNEYNAVVTYEIMELGGVEKQIGSVTFGVDMRGYDYVTNRGELFRIMATVVEVCDLARKRHAYDVLHFNAMKKDNESLTHNQRFKLYDKYIKSKFPNAVMEIDGNDVFYHLNPDVNEGFLKNNIDDTNFSDLEIREEQDPDVDNTDLIQVDEIGDASATPYPFSKYIDDIYPIKRDDGKIFKMGTREYKFTTDSGVKYEVELIYKVGQGEKDGDDICQSVEVAYSADGLYSGTINRGEMFKVMSTIVSILKKSREDDSFEMIEFSTYPKDRSDTVENPLRKKLYTQYISKSFPNARFKQGRTFRYTVAYLGEDTLIDPHPDEDSEGNKYDFLPDEEIHEHYHKVSGGYKKYIRDHIGQLGIEELAAMWEDQLTEEFDDITDDDVGVLIEANMLNILGEKTYKDLRRDAPNYLRVRDKSKKTPGSRYQYIDENNVIHFITPSHTKPGVTYEQKVKLLDLEELINTQSGIRKPIEIVRMAIEGDIEVNCTDPSWLYWGWKYMGTKDKYALEPEPRYPKVRNPNLKGSVCKHLDNVLFILPFQSMSIVKDLRKQGRL